jgi:hypothetical protein
MKSDGTTSCGNGFASDVGAIREKAVREDAQAEVELLFECQLPLI